jgi:hypothetical protein
MPNSFVYVDGFNLYYGALKRTPYKWLDLAKLSQVMFPNDRLEPIQYFTACVSARPHNPSAPLDQQVYLRALRTIPNLSITFGYFLTHSVPMTLTGVNPPKKWAITSRSNRRATCKGESIMIENNRLKGDRAVSPSPKSEEESRDLNV